MKKKVLAALLSAAMIGTMLAGCGSKGGDDAKESSTKETGKREMKWKVMMSPHLLSGHSLRTTRISIQIWQRNGMRKIRTRK